MKINNYIDSVNYIIKCEFKEIIATQDSLLLIKLYSDLYNGGQQCSTCVNSQRKYFEKLKLNGKIMANKLEQAKIRKCVPAWDGKIFISRVGNHYFSNSITDEDAIYLLSNNYISKEKFLVLPFEEKQIVETQEIRNCIEEIKEQLIEGISKSKIKDRYKSVSMIGEEKCSQKLILELIKKAENEINQI